jgi:hypothetical protein
MPVLKELQNNKRLSRGYKRQPVLDVASDWSVTLRGDNLITHKFHNGERNGFKEDDVSHAKGTR